MYINTNRYKHKKVGLNYINESSEFMKVLCFSQDNKSFNENKYQWYKDALDELIIRIRSDLDMIKKGSRKFHKYKFFEKHEFIYLHKHTQPDFKKFCEVACNFHDNLIDLRESMTIDTIQLINFEEKIKEILSTLKYLDQQKQLKIKYGEILDFFFDHVYKSLEQFFGEITF